MTQWTTGGPYGNINTLTLSQNFAIDQTIFAGTSLRVYKSINGGGNWKATLTRG